VRKSGCWVALPTLNLLLSLGAQAPQPLDPALRARFGFHGPLVHKLADGINLLLVGTTERVAVVQNPLRGRIELLRVEGTPPALRVTSEAVAREASGLQLADVDGDGSADLMFVDAAGRLGVKLRGQGRQPLPEIDVGKPGSDDCLRAGDLDGDGKADAAVVTQQGLVIVTAIDRGGRVSRADPIGERVRAFALSDLDGDGKQDVVVGTAAERMPLLAQLGRGDSSFGAWQMPDVPALTSLFAGAGADGKPTLAVLESKPARLVEYAAASAATARPRVELTTLPATTRNSLAFAYGDLDGDGDSDLVLADAERARLTWLLEQGGQFDVRHSQALAGIQSLALADLDADQKPDLVLAAPDEDALAWKRGGEPLDRFPERIAVDGKPIAVAADPRGGLVVLTRNQKREAALQRLQHGKDGAWTSSTFPLGRLANDPQRLLLAELDAVPGPEIAFVVPNEGLRILRATPQGGYVASDESKSEAAAFTRRMEDGALDLDTHDGQSVLVVARERFRREFRLDAQGQPQILHQISGPEGSSTIALAGRLADGTSLYYERAANKLWRVPPGRAAQSIDVPPIGATHLLAHGDAALLLSPKGVLRVSPGAGLVLRAVRSHEPPDEKSRCFLGVAADFDHDGTRELAVVDAHLHGVHLFAAGPQGLRRALSFPAFELPGEDEDVYEPRAIAAGDLDGDGRADLVLIAQDRVLVYLQEK
jgi:hypothetical protein